LLQGLLFNDRDTTVQDTQKWGRCSTERNGAPTGAVIVYKNSGNSG